MSEKPVKASRPGTSQRGRFPADPETFSKDLGLKGKPIKAGQRWRTSDRIEIEYHRAGAHAGEPSKGAHYHVKTRRTFSNGTTSSARFRKPGGSSDYFPGDRYTGD